MNTGAKSFAQAMEIGIAIYRQVEKQLLEAQNSQGPISTMSDGSFCPDLKDDKEACKIVSEAIESLDFQEKVQMGLRVKASNFFTEGK